MSQTPSLANLLVQTTHPGTRLTAPLHAIITGNGLIYATSTYKYILSASHQLHECCNHAATVSRYLLFTRQLSNVSAVIIIGSFVLVVVSDSIWLPVFNLILLIFLIQLQVHVFILEFIQTIRISFQPIFR